MEMPQCCAAKLVTASNKEKPIRNMVGAITNGPMNRSIMPTTPSKPRPTSTTDAAIIAPCIYGETYMSYMNYHLSYIIIKPSYVCIGYLCPLQYSTTLTAFVSRINWNDRTLMLTPASCLYSPGAKIQNLVNPQHTLQLRFVKVFSQ